MEVSLVEVQIQDLSAKDYLLTLGKKPGILVQRRSLILSLNIRTIVVKQILSKAGWLNYSHVLTFWQIYIIICLKSVKNLKYICTLCVLKLHGMGVSEQLSCLSFVPLCWDECTNYHILDLCIALFWIKDLHI